MTKIVFMIAIIPFITLFSQADTAYTAYSQSFGFSLTRNQSTIEICTEDQKKCLSFLKSIPKKGNSTEYTEYKEENGKCKLTVEQFEKNFATGNTQNEFMLNLTVFVVKVTENEESCKLKVESLKDFKSLTGIYL